MNNKKKLKSIISKPTYKNHVSITEKLVICAEKQNELFLNKPLYIGTTILDFAKYHMYDFYYIVLKKHYNDKITLCYTDTDSFILEIEIDDIYQDLVHYFKEYIDFSEYDDMHPIFYGKSNAEIIELKKINQSVLGKFKDELSGNLMSTFIAVRAKSYYYDVYDIIKKQQLKAQKKNKGIKADVVKRSITGDDYQKCVLEKQHKIVKQNLIQSYKHQCYTLQQRKIGLNDRDDKRIILEDRVNTLPHGHYSLFE